MHMALARLRAFVRRIDDPEPTVPDESAACSWDAMRATYEQQAARGIPEAVKGLELIERGRWPSSGRHRDGSGPADG